MHSVLLAIEDAYSCLLDIEDMDSIQKALGPAAEGYVECFCCFFFLNSNFFCSAQYLQNKRRAIVDELFKLLSVFIPDDSTPMVPDPNNQYILYDKHIPHTLPHPSHPFYHTALKTNSLFAFR